MSSSTRQALLRSALKDRIEALARGVQGGIFAPNEARQQEGLDAVEFGDEPRVQQQVVPLSAAGKIPAAPAPPLHRPLQLQQPTTTASSRRATAMQSNGKSETYLPAPTGSDADELTA